MSEQIAFRSDAPEVLAAWQEHRDRTERVAAQRWSMSERYGRGLMVNRLGFGHGTRVVGFERLESDEPGDIIGENGELRVPKNGYGTTVEPNLRRKAGKELAQELATLNQQGPETPGMPPFALVGMRSLAPALFEHDGAIYALWADDITDNGSGGEVDADMWERIPLSVYYAADEARKAVAS